MSKLVHPPKWPLMILRLILKEEYFEEVEGDMEEIFKNNLDRHSPKQAKMIYTWDVIRLLRPSLIKNFGIAQMLNPNSAMTIDNLKISLRVFSKEKSYTLINILGMSSGLAIALLIILYARFELSYETNNPLADRLVRVTMDYLNGETLIDQDCETYHPMGPRMLDEFSELVDFTRAHDIGETTVGIEEDFFREPKVYAADASFFELFNYPLIQGNPKNIFSAPYEAVLTETQAIQYFDHTDVLGESLWLSQFDKRFKITGIIPDSPPNTHLKVELLISYPSIKAAFGEEDYVWNNNSTLTYLLLSDQAMYPDFLKNLEAFNDRLHGEEKILNERIIAQPVKDIHLYSHKSYEAEKNGDATAVFFLLGVAILVIIIAIVNYINLSTSKSLDRAKEVGIRKVIGSSLGQLRLQFFTESFLINFFSGLFALTLMVFAIPTFRNMAGLPPGFHFVNDRIFWYIFITTILFSTLIAGIFPAFILSSFRPASVLKGRFSSSGKGIILRKTLVIFQFSITIFLLVQTLTAEQQLNYMQEKDLGLDIERTIVIRAPHTQELRGNYHTFKDELLAYPQFQSVSLSNCVPGLPSSEMGSTNVDVNLVGALEKQSFNFYIYFIDADFISTMKMSLKAGENFLTESKNQDLILVNEEAIRLWGIPSPEQAIGKQIDLWFKPRTIIGVIKDFHQASAKSAHIPMIFLYRPWFNRLASIRTQSGDVREDLALVNDVYQSVFPDSPFDYFFLDQEFDKQYRADDQFRQVFGTLTGFAILIACLGLFGLVSFTVAKRTKEIGVRKVLGANISQIVTLLSKDFISLIFFSMIISLPATYFLIEKWLEGYAFRIDLSAWLFFVPAMAVLAVSLVTVLVKTFKVSNVNPVLSLRDE